MVTLTFFPEPVVTVDLHLAVIDVAETTVKDAAATPPMETAVAPVKLVPVIVKVVVELPDAGLTPVTVGGDGGEVTVKATVPLVPPAVLTEIVFAPAAIDGIVIVADVVEVALHVAAVPLTLHVVAPTMKLVPVNVAEDPAKPLVGETPESVGAGTVTLNEPVAELPTLVTVTTFAPAASDGTVAVADVSLDLVAVTAVPPILQPKFCGGNPLPVRVITVPTGPLDGVTLVKPILM